MDEYFIGGFGGDIFEETEGAVGSRQTNSLKSSQLEREVSQDVADEEAQKSTQALLYSKQDPSLDVVMVGDYSYNKADELGEGAFAVVYHGKEKKDPKKVVAIKVYSKKKFIDTSPALLIY